jgi:16S rRNA (guanine966-N2)-methyltransferase
VAPAATRNQLRIIGGKWRGRKLRFADAEGLRPTGDRIRETLFNWLQGDLPDSLCLDLFAGSGALGLEALSRGARQVQFIEKNQRAAQQIREHLQLLEATASASVVSGDALQWLQQPGPAADVIFLDPPFAADLWQAVIAALETGQRTRPGTLIYIETPREYLLQTPPHWALHREKLAGQVGYRLYRVN